MVERFNRTLKTKMWKYFTRHNTKKYIDILPALVTSYNNSKHRIIKMSPSQVNSDNEAMLRSKMYDNVFTKSPMFRFKIGDYVKIKIHKKPFEKGYIQNWSSDTYIVHEKHATKPVTYRVKQVDGKEILGTYYHHQLQHVAKPALDILSQIEIVRSDSNRYFIHYKEWDARFDEWIQKDELNNI